VAVDTRELEPLPGRVPTLWQRLSRLRSGLKELVFVTALYVGYSSSRLLASDNAGAAKHRAMQILRIEQATGLDIEHALNNFFAQHDVVGLLGCYWYATAHYVLTLVVLVWLYLKGQHAYLPARRALLVGTVLALALYLMLPTAPPRFFPDLGYIDVLKLHSDQGWWGSDASAPRGMGQLTNELAAFPSLHCGWALWVALCVHRNARSWILRILAWLSAAATAVAVIGTGNHWTLDVIVGWMVIIAGVVGVASFTRPPRSAEPSPAHPQESS
jgi:membrane-associated phospholipid phosphatase